MRTTTSVCPYPSVCSTILVFQKCGKTWNQRLRRPHHPASRTSFRLPLAVASLTKSQSHLPIACGARFSCFAAQHNFAVVTRTSRATATNKRVFGRYHMHCCLWVFTRKPSLLEPVPLAAWPLGNWPCKDCLLIRHIFFVADALSFLCRFIFYCRSWNRVTEGNLRKSIASQSWTSVQACFRCLQAETLPQPQGKRLRLSDNIFCCRIFHRFIHCVSGNTNADVLPRYALMHCLVIVLDCESLQNTAHMRLHHGAYNEIPERICCHTQSKSRHLAKHDAVARVHRFQLSLCPYAASHHCSILVILQCRNLREKCGLLFNKKLEKCTALFFVLIIRWRRQVPDVVFKRVFRVSALAFLMLLLFLWGYQTLGDATR